MTAGRMVDLSLCGFERGARLLWGDGAVATALADLDGRYTLRLNLSGSLVQHGESLS